MKIHPLKVDWGQHFFPKESLSSAYKNGFLADQDIYFSPLRSCVFWLSSRDLGKFGAFCLTSEGVSARERAPVQLDPQRLERLGVAFASSGCGCGVCVRGIGHGGSGFIKVDLEGGARREKKLPV